MESHFTAIQKSSKARVITASELPVKLAACNIADALRDARRMADEEIGAVEIRFVMSNGTSVHMANVRPGVRAVSEHHAWLAARRKG